MIDADLGGGVIKQRVARDGGGRSGGFRTIILFRLGRRAVFAFGFAKNDQANLSARNLSDLRKLGSTLLAATEDEIDRAIATGRYMEIEHGEDV